MLDYASLAALAAIARTGSFEGAAEALSVTPSAISQRIKGLEERLGQPLIIRTTPCRATAAGTRLIAHHNQVRLLEDEIFTSHPEWASRLDAPRPSLKIAVNADSLFTWFPEAVAAFATSNSSTLDLSLDDEALTAERLKSGEVVAAVNAMGKTVTGCRTLALGSIRYVATCTPHYYARYLGRGMDAETFRAAPVLRFSPHDRLQLQWTKMALGQTVEGPTHWVPSTPGMLDFTLRHIGWSMTPLSSAQPLLDQGALITLSEPHFIDVALYWQHLSLTTRALAPLTEAVRQAAARWLIPPA